MSSYKVSIYPQNVALIDFSGILNPAVMGRAFHDCYQRKCYNVIIDLANTDHAPGKALEIFSQTADTIRHLNGSLVFVRVDGPIQIVLDMMGITDKFKFYENREDALRDVIESCGHTTQVQL